MDLRCLTCDIRLEHASANKLNEPVPELKSFVLSKIFEECLQMETTEPDVICDGCKVQLILFYQFKLKVVALQLRRLEETKEVEDNVKEPDTRDDETHSVGDPDSSEDTPDIPDEYNCIHCSATFVVHSALVAHIHGLHSKSASCTDCNEQFQSYEDLKQHKKAIHGSKSFVCHICGNRFTKATRLRLHIKTKHDSPKQSCPVPKPQMIACDICDKILSNRSSLRRHKISVHYIGTKKFPFPCDICATYWPTKTSLETHHLSKHTTERNFKCAVCDKSFATKHVLVSHINRVHCYTKDFICHTCGKSFKSQTYLNTHYRVHSQKKAFFCADCGVSFKQEATLYAHRKMHREKSAGVTYECQECKTTFISARTLKKHQMTHTGPDLNCNQCGKTYKQKDSLTKHISSVHNKVKLRVMCRLCDKTLWNRSRMRSHVLDEHSDVLKTDPGKGVDDYLENTQIHDETKSKTEKKNLQIISVQILNHV